MEQQAWNSVGGDSNAPSALTELADDSFQIGRKLIKNPNWLPGLCEYEVVSGMIRDMVPVLRAHSFTLLPGCGLR